jgi:hypothetical protein
MDTTTHPPLENPGCVDTLWMGWRNATAPFFVPAFLGREGASLLLDWTFRGKALESQDWCVLDGDGDVVANDPSDIARSAHQALAVDRHFDAFFDGVEAIIEALCGGMPTDVDMVEVSLTPQKGTLETKLALYSGGKNVSIVLQTTQDLRRVRTLMQQEPHTWP